jgi:hypothetical protein
MSRTLLSPEVLTAYVQAVWDQVLVPVCKASISPDERWSFVYGHTEDPHPATQWRFQGCFGFGGKLITASNLQCRVSYYPEHATPELNRRRDQANGDLALLWAAMVAPHMHAKTQ